MLTCRRWCVLALAETDTNLKLNRLEEAAVEGLAVWDRLQENGLAGTYMAVGVSEQRRRGVAWPGAD